MVPPHFQVILKSYIHLNTCSEPYSPYPIYFTKILVFKLWKENINCSSIAEVSHREILLPAAPCPGVGLLPTAAIPVYIFGTIID